MWQTPGLDRSQCDGGAGGPFRIWVNGAENDYYAWAGGREGVVYVFDIDGNRLVFEAGFPDEANYDEADPIVETFEFSTN